MKTRIRRLERRRHGSAARRYADAMTTRDFELAALLTLLRTKSRDQTWGSIAADAAYVGSARTLIDSADAEGLFPAPALAAEWADAEHDVTHWRRQGLRWVTVLDGDYPARLRDIREMPPFLFYDGQLDPLEEGLSVVGSRSASPWGLRFAAETAEMLVSKRLSVLSGLAEGIDTAAHSAALAVGGRTVAFLGTGIQQSYPASNKQLQCEIAQRGLVLSQFYPDAPPTKHTFPMRNATMSGYGLATIVVEAGEFSGARIQARVAGEHGRPVILTDRVVSATEWGAAMQKRRNVRVVRSISELSEAIDELRDLPQRLEQALAAVID